MTSKDSGTAVYHSERKVIKFAESLESNMNAFFFGAGCSCGTLGDECPTAAKFGARVLANDPNWKEHYKKLSELIEVHLNADICELGLEEIWTFIDYYCKFHDAFPTPALYDLIPELKSALLSVYGGPIDRKAHKLKPTEAFTLSAVLRQVEPGDAVISFNYDTLVERFALSRGLDLRSFSKELRSDVVNFAKPHGSTSWCLDLEQKCVTHAHPDGAPLLESLTPAHVSNGREPLVLGAVPIKSELLREVQSYYKVDQVFDVIMRQWTAVIQSVKKAERIVVVGYSFPREDHYGRFLFAEAMKLRSENLPFIEFFETCDRAAERSAAIRETFSPRNSPSVSQVLYKGSVQAADPSS
ncbi:MAG TPA: hypothetical protein VKR43_06605 [Bryobacteraceae bacterium]|nr:hypothetical protein [Bryobacteraceae bacterium]